MKPQLALLAAALLVVSALFAYPALSTPTTPSASISARLRTLEAKAKTLDAKLRALQTSQRATAAKVASLDSCLDGGYGVVRTGGYVWTADGGASVSLVPALDIADTGEAAQGYFASVAANCMQGAQGTFELQTLGK
jgi:hypothetical protein